MNISIIIPNYNGEEILKKNLPKVIDSVSNYDGAIEIIVIDDCSEDNSVNYIKYEIENIKNTYKKSNINLRLLVNSRNLGFSSTVNRGVKTAKGEVVLLLNTDVVPEKDFLKPLISHFQDEKIFAVGCMDKSIEGSGIVLRGRGVGAWKRGFFVHSRGDIDKTSTLWVSCGSGVFRKSIWYKLGGLDTLYNPFYWEDIDLSYRAIKSGYKILFEPKSIVVHQHEKGAIKSSYSKDQIKTIAYRNQFIFVWKNTSDVDLIFLHFNFWLYYHFFKAFIRRDWSFFIGFIQALYLLPRIMISKFRAQRLFVKSDKKVIEELL